MNTKPNEGEASYFGLPIEVISLMDYYSLICFQGREFIVDTVDLVFSRSLRQAA
jgi:hypothetical protein